MLHVANGEMTLALLAGANLPGRAFALGETLSEGPVRGPRAPEEDAAFRSVALEHALGIPQAEYRSKVDATLDALAAAKDADEVVLWFEADFFCEANLLWTIDHLARHGAGERLSLVYPPDALNARSARELARLFVARARISKTQVAAAREAWEAYAAPEPVALARLAASGVEGWPRLADGLRAHLARFPSTSAGIGGLEAATLSALEDGPLPFSQLHRALKRDPLAERLGMTDLSFAATLAHMARGPEPLVEITGYRGLEGADLRSWRVRATSAGLATHAGARDDVRARGIDAWLGGVRLSGRGPTWRWDGRTVVRA